jgi:hypothetical protein
LVQEAPSPKTPLHRKLQQSGSTTPAVAATSANKSAAFTAARLFDPATISLRTLPNGVRGIVKQTQGTGVVAVQVWVRAGSRFRNPKLSWSFAPYRKSGHALIAQLSRERKRWRRHRCY